MKKLIALLLVLVCAFDLVGCGNQTPEHTETFETDLKISNNTESEISNKPIMVYIKELHNEMVSFDEIEWIIVPSERATELDITDDDAPNGFFIYNEESIIAECNIADKCVICILDWENNYVEKQIELGSFMDILEQRGNFLIPYILTIEDGNVINIREQYIP